MRTIGALLLVELFLGMVTGLRCAANPPVAQRRCRARLRQRVRLLHLV